MYIRKSDNKVIIEIYSSEFEPVLEKRLTDLKFVYKTENFFNDFWGTRFIIDRPRGKGSIARLNILEEITK